ncbi:hypothetical protein EPK99_01325 [Neorhizobium lilium]|uniref:Uncharacterized protein n=1 Tax=Neorhizobium lilium TaxID=2503024 RepID=A0A3S3SAF9_9HYPH|nr:hypothetical protein [Neorhizobium lilium]RWX81004.1 hypothetical protein EPK99_01325 [Neorhizobium lilium]
MPVKFTRTKAEFSGECTVEEAETIFEWLRKTPKGELHLAGVTHFHAAILQTLMITQNKISAMPRDSFAAECMRQVRSA